MYCKYCGKPVDSDAQFCSFCGKRIGADNACAPVPTSAQSASSTVPGNNADRQTIYFSKDQKYPERNHVVERIFFTYGQAVNRGDLVISLNWGPQTFCRYYATLSGYISRVFVAPGQTVQDGQPLIETSTTPVTIPTPQPVPVQNPTPAPKPAAPAPKAAAQPVASSAPRQSAAVKTNIANQQPKENVLLGTLGAVLSAAAVGLALAYLTYHGAFGTQFGILLPCLAILSYQKFGNKISFFSILLAVALTAATPYLAHRAAWAWALKEGGWVTSLFEAFKMVPEYIGTAIPRTDYKSSLQDLYLFCILGIVLPLLGILWSLIKALFASIFKK